MFYLEDKTEYLSPGHSISDNSDGPQEASWGDGEPGYIGVFATKTR